MVAADPNGDFYLIDNLEPVTLRAAAEDAGLAVEHAKRREITTKEISGSGGRYLSGDTRWHLHVDEVAVPPLPGWQIIDAVGVVWTALEVVRSTWDHRWKLVCRNLAIAERLNDRITIQIAAHGKGEAGDEEPRWADWKTGVLARIQPDRIDRGMEGSVRSENATFTIILGESIDFVLDVSAYRIVDAGGRRFRISTIEQYERIDFLPQIFAEEEGLFDAP